MDIQLLYTEKIVQEARSVVPNKENLEDSNGQMGSTDVVMRRVWDSHRRRVYWGESYGRGRICRVTISRCNRGSCST